MMQPPGPDAGAPTKKQQDQVNVVNLRNNLGVLGFMWVPVGALISPEQ